MHLVYASRSLHALQQHAACCDMTWGVVGYTYYCVVCLYPLQYRTSLHVQLSTHLLPGLADILSPAICHCVSHFVHVVTPLETLAEAAHLAAVCCQN